MSSLCGVENKIVCSDAISFIKSMPKNCVDIVCTSPPFWQQRDYGHTEQLGMEETFEEYLISLIDVFRSIKRVLKPTGTCWVNLGDSFNENTGGYFDHKNNDAPSIGKNRIKTNKYQKGYPRRSLLLIPHRFAIKMTDEEGWIVRNVNIWKKTTCQPTTARNRLTIEYEPFFMFCKTLKYKYYKYRAKYILNEGDCFSDSTTRELRSIWSFDSERSGKVKHIAPYSEDVVQVPILLGSDYDDLVFDPFMGSGTTAVMAKKLGRNFVGCDLLKDSCEAAKKRISDTVIEKREYIHNFK